MHIYTVLSYVRVQREKPNPQLLTKAPVPYEGWGVRIKASLLVGER